MMEAPLPPPPRPEDVEALELWQRAASALGLDDGEGFFDLRGRVDGHSVHVLGLGDPASAADLELLVVVLLEHPLPDGTVMKASDSPSGVGLGDPILDGFIETQSSDPGAVARRVCRESVRGLLLEVLRQFPASATTAERIELRAGPGFGDPAPLIRLVVDLAHALDE